jgi:hypothetical protein
MSLSFRPHPEIRPRVDPIGADRAPVMVIDNFVADPEALIGAAEAAFALKSEPRSYFPGIVSAVPQAYAMAAVDFLMPALCRTFGVSGHVLQGGCDFQLVTTPPSDLTQRQSIPHFDAADPTLLASVHYLCAAPFRGTAFYRHVSTGVESIDRHRLASYEASLAEELERHPPTGYIDGDTPLFSRLAEYEPVFNRIILFRGASLHSGLADSGHGFAPDPRTGRLTTNLFLKFAS